MASQALWECGPQCRGLVGLCSAVSAPLASLSWGPSTRFSCTCPSSLSRTSPLHEAVGSPPLPRVWMQFWVALTHAQRGLSSVSPQLNSQEEESVTRSRLWSDVGHPGPVSWLSVGMGTRSTNVVAVGVGSVKVMSRKWMRAELLSNVSFGTQAGAETGHIPATQTWGHPSSS